MVRKRHEGRSAPKYRPDPMTQLVAERGLKAILKQLIEEYGHESFQSAIEGIEVDESTPARKAGRPDTINTDMHLADWIYSVAEDHREKKKPNPVEQAEIDLYDLMLDESERRELSFTRWQKRAKEKRLRGLAAWRALARQVQTQPDAAKALGQRLPIWLERYNK